MSLFELARTIKYESRPGRSPAARRAAFDDLLACLRAARDARSAAGRHDLAALDRALQALVAAGRLGAAEDEIDAYVCAYVAIYHRRWHGRRSLVVGDVASGYIVTRWMPPPHTALRQWGARLAVPVASVPVS